MVICRYKFAQNYRLQSKVSCGQSNFGPHTKWLWLRKIQKLSQELGMEIQLYLAWHNIAIWRLNFVSVILA